jgi:hypothetical protein
MKLLYINLADTVVDGTTLLSDCQADPGYPLGNLSNPLRTKTWRASAGGTANPHYLSFDLGTPQTANAIAVINSNMAPDPSLTLLGSSNSSTWTTVATIGNSGVSLDGLCVYKYFTAVSFRYWRLTFSPTVGFPVFIGRVFLGQAMTLSANFNVGYSDIQTAVATQQVSLGGQIYVDQRNKFRSFDLSFRGITDAGKYSEMMAFANTVGLNRYFVATVDPTNDATSGQTSIYGKLNDFPQFKNSLRTPSGSFYEAQMRLVEAP